MTKTPEYYIFLSSVTGDVRVIMKYFWGCFLGYKVKDQELGLAILHNKNSISGGFDIPYGLDNYTIHVDDDYMAILTNIESNPTNLPVTPDELQRFIDKHFWSSDSNGPFAHQLLDHFDIKRKPNDKNPPQPPQ